MADNKATCDEFLSVVSRRRHTHGKWFPVMFFVDMMITTEDQNKLQRALESQGLVKTVLEQHGDLRIEFVRRNVLDNGKLQKRRFVCISTPKKPEKDTQKDNYGDVLQTAWDQYTSKKAVSIVSAAQQQGESVPTERQEETLRQPTVSLPQPTPSPPQPTATATSVSPSAKVPDLFKDDNELLDFFRGIICDQHLEDEKLFRPGMSAGSLRAKLAAFGKQLEINNHTKQYDLFYTAPTQHAVKDITTLEPDPCLTKKFHIPMSVPAMAEVAQALINLAEDAPEILQLPKFGGSKGHGKRILTIVPSINKQRLFLNAKEWMQSIIEHSTTNDTSTFDAVTVLIRVLLALNPMAFTHVAAEVPDSCLSKHKLAPDIQEAMMHKANLTLTQLRTIKSYLCYANMDMLQPENVIKSMQVTDFVKPVSTPYKECGTRTKVSWHMPVDELLLFNTNKALLAHSFDCLNLCNAHVILVGDHGQGAFRMMATLLLIVRQHRRPRRSTVNEYIGTKLALEVDGQCGYIQCQKDTYNVLKDTIAIPINEDLWRVKNKGRVTIYRASDGTVKMCWGNIHTQQGDVLQSAKVEIFMVGDLAFYAMALGKENMAPHWCWRCQLSKKEWTNDPDSVGEPWTVQNMKSHLAKLESGELNKNKSNKVRGITQQMSFDSIWICNTLVPSLHNNELFLNTPIKELLRWIHHRIEKLPLAVIDVRDEVVDCLLKLEEATIALAEATDAVRLLGEEHKALKPVKRRVTKELVFRNADHKNDWDAHETVCNEALAAEKACDKEYKALKKELTSLQQKEKEVVKDKKHGALTQQVRQDLESMLQRLYHIVRSAYHGGDFEGNHCRKWVSNAHSVMESIEVLLLGIPSEERAADDQEIQKYCKAFKRLFQYFDALIHYCHQPFGTLTDVDMVDVRKLVNLLDRLCRRIFETVPPKAHAWQHLLVDLDRLRGLKHHSESKIERAHQVGRRIDLMFRGVHDVDKKIDCSLTFQHTDVKPSMTMVQQSVKKTRSRPKKRTADEMAADEEDNHRDIPALLLMDEIVDDFPCLFALAVVDKKKAMANEVEANVVNDVNVNVNNNNIGGE